jgi:hypothetical protein
MSQQEEMSQQGFESLVLSYCNKYVGVPGTKQLGQYLSRKLGQDLDSSPFVNGFDRQFLELAEILQDDHTIMYHIWIMNPNSLQIYDLYLNSEPEEQNGETVFFYYLFLGNLEAQDPLIHDFVSTLVCGKPKRVAFIDKEDLVDFDNLRVIKENDVVYNLNEFSAWNRSKTAQKHGIESLGRSVE